MAGAVALLIALGVQTGEASDRTLTLTGEGCADLRSSSLEKTREVARTRAVVDALTRLHGFDPTTRSVKTVDVTPLTASRLQTSGLIDVVTISEQTGGSQVCVAMKVKVPKGVVPTLIKKHGRKSSKTEYEEYAAQQLQADRGESRPLHSPDDRRARVLSATSAEQTDVESQGASDAPPPPPSLEWFVDLYLGYATTKKADVETRFTGLGNATLQNATFDSSLVAGGRIGTWLQDLPVVGFAVDGFYFTTNLPPQTVTACGAGGCAVGTTTAASDQGHFGISLDLMLRLPLLVHPSFPRGQIQPYVTAGPAVFVSTWDEPGFTQAKTTTLGFKGGGGVRMLLTKTIGLFGEYRLTYFKPEQQFQAGGISLTASNQLTTHHFIGGLAFHF